MEKIFPSLLTKMSEDFQKTWKFFSKMSDIFSGKSQFFDCFSDNL